MSRCVSVFLFFFALTLLSYSECAPQQIDLSDPDFIKKRDDSVRDLIEKEKLTCENVGEFCYREPAKDENDSMAKEACKLILQTYLCK